MRYRVVDVVMQMLERDASEGGDARSGPLLDSRVCHERLLSAMAEVYVDIAGYFCVAIYVCVYVCMYVSIYLSRVCPVYVCIYLSRVCPELVG